VKAPIDVIKDEDGKIKEIKSRGYGFVCF